MRCVGLIGNDSTGLEDIETVHDVAGTFMSLPTGRL